MMYSSKIKSIFLLASILLPLSSFAQTQRYFCELRGEMKYWTAGLNIIIDLGDKASYGSNGNLRLVDEKGEVIKFNSMVDAGNYMSGKGWTFQQAYYSEYDKRPLVHWIFYKDAESLEEARKGLLTKGEVEPTQRKEVVTEDDNSQWD